MIIALFRGLLDLVDEVESGRKSSLPPRHHSQLDDYSNQHTSDSDERLNRSHDGYRSRQRHHDDRANSSYSEKSHSSTKQRDQYKDITSEATSEDELEESKVLEDIFFLK